MATKIQDEDEYKLLTPVQKTDNILVSIIVCSRNEEKYIEECINSLTSQKSISGEYEIIIVDGMSDDGTREILLKLADKDEKIILMDNPAIVKPPAVNIGFRKSKGKFWQFVMLILFILMIIFLNCYS